MLEPFLKLFLKSSCPLCQRQSDRKICQDCERQLQGYRYANPRLFWRGDLPVFVWGRYEGQLKRAIASVKYDRHPDLAVMMGRWIAESWRASPPLGETRLTIIPIPLHANRLKERGFNQAEAIAKGFCHFTGYYLQNRVLFRVKDTDALFGLSLEERTNSIQNAFSVDRSFSSRLPILLIDDIYTTGTTVKEAAKVLRQRGYVVSGVIALSSPKNS